MKLIADSGSTKTDWVLLDDKGVVFEKKTRGYNPNHSGVDVLEDIVKNELDCRCDVADIKELWFYGAGCSDAEETRKVYDCLTMLFPKTTVYVEEDTLAACHALFGDEAGVACILGTGANASLYDGKNILSEPPSLGFILGDDGSGSYIGRNLIRHYVYNTMPQHIRKDFDFDFPDFIQKIYHGETPAKHIASYAKFVDSHIDDPFIHDLVYDCFKSYVDNFLGYFADARKMKIAFVGSIAFSLQDILRECLTDNGYNIVKVLKSPHDAMIQYHLKH